MTNTDWALIAPIAAPIVLGLLARLLRRPQYALADLARATRDLITLRMVLRDADPDQRAELLDAHRSWRCERVSSASGTSRQRKSARRSEPPRRR